MLVNSYRFGGAAFTPLSVAGCVLWHDASDTSSITSSGGAVSQWNDKSASGWHVTQSTAAEKPTTGANTQNGRNTISFDGGDLLRHGSTTTVPASNYTIFMAFKKTGANLGFEAAPVTLTSGNSPRPFDAYNGIRFSYGTGGGGYPDVRSITSFSVLLSRDTSNTLSEYVNGVFAKAASGSLTNTSQVLTIGSRGDSFTRLRGDVGEIIIYNSSISNADANTVGSYLAAKWGTSWATIT